MRERSRSWPVGRIAPVIVLVVVLLAGAAAWAGFGLRPTPRELADRFTTRIAELAGFQPPPRIEPASVSPVAAVPPGSAASTAPSLAPDSPPAAPAPAPTPTVAVPAPAAGPAPGAAPSAAATPAVVPPAAVTPSPVAAPSASGSETASVAPLSATPAPADNATPLTSQTIDAANQAPISPAKPVQQVLLRAIADSWVEIRQKGGRTLLRRTMRPGDTWPIPADPTLVPTAATPDGWSWWWTAWRRGWCQQRPAPSTICRWIPRPLRRTRGRIRKRISRFRGNDGVDGPLRALMCQSWGIAIPTNRSHP